MTHNELPVAGGKVTTCAVFNVSCPLTSASTIISSQYTLTFIVILYLQQMHFQG